MPGKLLSVREVLNIFSIHRTTWYKWMLSDPECPRPKIKQKRFSRWDEEEVMKYRDVLIQRTQQRSSQNTDAQ